MNTWFVTGASRGLGLNITRHLLATGNTVFATARDPDRIAAQPGDENDRLIVAKLSQQLANLDLTWQSFSCSYAINQFFRYFRIFKFNRISALSDGRD